MKEKNKKRVNEFFNQKRSEEECYEFYKKMGYNPKMINNVCCLSVEETKRWVNDVRWLVPLSHKEEATSVMLELDRM